MTDVGLIGLGTMGGAISRNLLAAGLSVAGYDLDVERREELRNAGGRPCASVEETVAESAVVLTLLPSAEALRDVAVAIARGVVARRPAVAPIVAEMSTLAERDKRVAADLLGAAGVTLLDCPLSGTGVQAEAGDLVVYASGDAASLARCAPVFAKLGRAVYQLGEFGLGTRVKLVANLLVAIHIVAAAEALNLARAVGLELTQTLAALSDGAGTSRMLEVRGPMMVAGSYVAPSMTLRLFAKDEQLIREFVAAAGVETALFEDASRVLQRAAADGHAEHDTSAVYAVLAAAETRPAPIG